MYHCYIDFYCVGHQRGIFDQMKDMPAMEAFTHAFTVTEEPDEVLARRADVIFADLRDMDPKSAVRILSAGKKAEAELILLAEPEQIVQLADELGQVRDIWTMPMPEAELHFRFLRWQQTYKARMDAWQANHYLDSILDHSPDLIWFKTADGVHERVNDSFCKTVNKTIAQIQGQKYAYIWNADGEAPACTTLDQEAMRSGVTQVSEERIRSGDVERILATYKSPLYDLDGSVMGTVGIAHDITQERAYEQKLLRKNRALEWLFTTMDCGVICHTVDGSKIININQAALNILGYSSQEELEADGFDTVAASVLDEDKPKLRSCIQSLHQANDSANAEYRVLHKDGRLFYVIGNVKLVEENGEWFYQRFLLDCTAQKIQEQAKQNKLDQKIKYQEQLFQVFFTYLSNNTNDVYLMLNDTADRVEYISPNVERVLGISPEDACRDPNLLGHVLNFTGTDVDHKTLADLKPEEFLEARDTERINPKTGEHKWFRESIYCTKLLNEKKIIAYISDRTKERQTQDNLAEALEMAQVANKAKSAFLSSVSHDIRTPMNAIMGFITLLQEDAGNRDRVLEYTQRIDAASQHLLGLINDVLDLNKIESGSATLNLAELDLADVVDEINTIIRPQTRAREQIFDIHVSSFTYEHLIGDRLRINQILINILSNAVKYTQKGGAISMTVTELPQVVSDYSRIQFTISDNGQGMSEAYQKVIFAPFTREQDTLTNQVQGTGLGMSITKNLVDLMGGTIHVNSQLGKGSTFTVELELRIQEQRVDPEFWKKHGVSRMIVADDDESICLSIIRSMARTGVHVDYTTDGVTAVDTIRRAREAGRPYDLILLDWKMPGLSGLETARLIRKNYPVKIPILLFTAYDWEDIKDEALEVGIKHFLPKPFFMSNFKEAIQRIMAGKSKPTASTSNNVVGGKHIMVVDDIDVNRMILTKILGTMGATCEVAENGKEALDKFEASEPGTYDIILMDIQMPIMDGYSAARAIRASSHPSAKDIVVIAMTANAFVDDVREALSAGMDAHIAKPIVVDKMLSSIREVLEKRENCVS